MFNVEFKCKVAGVEALNKIIAELNAVPTKHPLYDVVIVVNGAIDWSKQ